MAQEAVVLDYIEYMTDNPKGTPEMFFQWIDDNPFTPKEIVAPLEDLQDQFAKGGIVSDGSKPIKFGNFQELIMANWGGVDLVLDPYSRKNEAIIEISVNTWWDVALRHVTAFAAMKDALI